MSRFEILVSNVSFVVPYFPIRFVKYIFRIEFAQIRILHTLVKGK